jgi:hypothetical protein
MAREGSSGDVNNCHWKTIGIFPRCVRYRAGEKEHAEIRTCSRQRCSASHRGYDQCNSSPSRSCRCRDCSGSYDLESFFLLFASPPCTCLFFACGLFLDRSHAVVVATVTSFFLPPPPQRPLSSAHSLSSLYLYPLKVLLLSLCALNFSWYLSWLRGVYALAPWRATLRLVRGISFVVTHIHARTHTHTRARTHTHTYLYFVALLAHYEQARIKFA